MILRVAHFRLSPDAADSSAATARALFDRIRRIDGLTWSTVGRQVTSGEVTLIAVSLWRDRAAMDRVLGTDAEGRSSVEAREGLPPAARVDLAEVVEGSVPMLGRTPVTAITGRRRRGLLPQDRELLRLLCSGVTLAEAARRLGVSVGTAKNRRHEIYEKLGVHGLEAACAVAASSLNGSEDAPRSETLRLS